MKKLLSVIMLFFALGLMSFSSAPEPTIPEVYLNDSCEITEDEGIFCKVRNASGTVIASCFICRCSDLAEAVAASI